MDGIPFEPGDLKGITHFAASLREQGREKITAYDCAYIHLAMVTGSA